MRGRVLLDAGPLVAYFRQDDEFHAWARESWAEIPAPLRTCEAVVCEACHLVRRPGSRQLILDLVARDIIRASFQLQAEAVAVRALMSKYLDPPMSLADACLVRMAELDEQAEILTLDSDFHIYRAHGRRALKLRLPPGR